MIDPDVILHPGVRIYNPDQVNIFGCEIGEGSFVGPFVEITRGVAIGKRCVIQSHAFLCTGVTLEDDVFIGHGAMFTNDLYPRVQMPLHYPPTLVQQGASVGTNATVIPGLTIGRYSVVGAGAVLTKSTEDYAIYAGNPARKLKQFDNEQALFDYMQSRQRYL